MRKTLCLVLTLLLLMTSAHAAFYDIDRSAIPEGNRPGAFGIEYRILIGDEEVESYIAEDQIDFIYGDYRSVVEGVMTFRGDNTRSTPAVGTIPSGSDTMEVLWEKNIGFIDKWTGVGWTGQPSIVRWSYEQLEIMDNVYTDKKLRGYLTEVIYATLDGHVYFLDLLDGSPTRDPINIGAPIKGSLAVDPRGWPLLYVGQGISVVADVNVPFALRIFSLIDGSLLYEMPGRDKASYRGAWGAFDASPMVDAMSDTLLATGENGIFYRVKLNTRFDYDAREVSVDPVVVKYVYTTPRARRLGIENSVAGYSHYAFFGDNDGLIQCVDTNTMTPVWASDNDDDTDSTIVLDEDDDGLWLYTACELDHRGFQADAHIRKLDALTGKEVWRVDIPVFATEEYNGGVFATPALGRSDLNGNIYYSVARTKHGGTLYCIDRASGMVNWAFELKQYGWSSPVCVYDENGRGYIIVSDSAGWYYMLSGLTGELICSLRLNANVEGSPAVFGDTFVVGTRGQRIYGIRFSKENDE